MPPKLRTWWGNVIWEPILQVKHSDLFFLSKELSIELSSSGSYEWVNESFFFLDLHLLVDVACKQEHFPQEEELKEWEWMTNVTLCTGCSWRQTSLAHDTLLGLFQFFKEKKYFFLLIENFVNWELGIWYLLQLFSSDCLPGQTTNHLAVFFFCCPDPFQMKVPGLLLQSKSI